MTKRPILILCFVFIVLNVSGFYCSVLADDLGKFEDQFKKKKSEQQEAPPDYDQETSDRKCLENIFVCMIGKAIGKILFAPFDAALNGDKFPISNYPYQYEEGNYVLPLESNQGRKFGLTGSMAYQYINRNIFGLLFQSRFRSYKRFGIDLDYIHFDENDNQIESHLNYFSLYLNFVPTEGFDYLFNYSIGYVGLIGANNQGGPAFSLNLIRFPLKPLMVEIRAGIAAVNWTPLWDISGELGYNVKTVQTFIGFRSLAGPEKDLSGPYIGLRYWF